MSWSQLPDELKELPQWVGSYDNKKPVDVKNGEPASVDDPRTWATFDQACKSGLPHIGFVFTKEDPYVFIDLDTGKRPELSKLHAEIVEKANSYTEASKSGTGSHIIVKGRLPAGLRADKQALEIYPHGRYMLATGWVYGERTIRENQPLIDYLSSQIEQTRITATELVSEESSLTDEQVWDKAANAENGQKFRDLFNNEWEQHDEYQNDHSRADLALAIFLDFYTRDVDQATRIFKYSKLYRPEKGRTNGDGTDYIHRTLKAARARNENDQPPPVDATVIAERAKAVAQQRKRPTTENTSTAPPLPPGLVGEIANYIYTSAVRPVPEVALMGALAMTAGIVGRQYNIPGSGLNLYLILLAPTGTGKEGAASGVSTLLSKVRETVPAADQFIGPAEFASGPALIKALDNQPCLFSILGEFGMRMQQMADPRSSGAEKTLQRALLNIYSKSGWHQTESSTAYSDREKNTKTLYAPALTIFGESTPETFFSKLNEDQVMSGLLPRFTFLEYKGKRPPKNDVNAFHDPDPGLVQRVADLTATAIQLQANQQCQPVLIDEHSQQLLDAFDTHCDTKINGGTEVYKQLWNRSHLKALRLAAVIAVGVNNVNPVVTVDIAQWAIDFVLQDVSTIEGRFATEEIGEGEHRHEAAIRSAIEDYLAMDAATRKVSYKVPAALLDTPVIPYTYIRRRLRGLSSFKNDRRGTARAIQESLRDLCDAGILQLVPAHQRKEKYGLRAEIYVIGESW